MGNHLVVQILILAWYPPKSCVHLLMPLLKFPLCWMVSDTQRPNEEHTAQKSGEQCQASRWIHQGYKGFPPRIALPTCRFFSLGWTHGTRYIFVDEGPRNLVWGTTQSTSWLHLSSWQGRTSLTSVDSLLISSANQQHGPDRSVLGTWAAPCQQHTDERGRKSLSTFRAGKGSTCLRHLQRNSFHWCCQL